MNIWRAETTHGVFLVECAFHSLLCLSFGSLLASCAAFLVFKAVEWTNQILQHPTRADVEFNLR